MVFSRRQFLSTEVTAAYAMQGKPSIIFLMPRLRPRPFRHQTSVRLSRASIRPQKPRARTRWSPPEDSGQDCRGEVAKCCCFVLAEDRAGAGSRDAGEEGRRLGARVRRPVCLGEVGRLGAGNDRRGEMTSGRDRPPLQLAEGQVQPCRSRPGGADSASPIPPRPALLPHSGLQAGMKRPTRALAADQGVCPTNLTATGSSGRLTNQL